MKYIPFGVPWLRVGSRAGRRLVARGAGVAIAVLCVLIVLEVGGFILCGLLHRAEASSKVIAKLVQSSIGVAIYSAYLMMSRRVKSTFVASYKRAMPPALSQAWERVETAEPVVVTTTGESS